MASGKQVGVSEVVTAIIVLGVFGACCGLCSDSDTSSSSRAQSTASAVRSKPATPPNLSPQQQLSQGTALLANIGGNCLQDKDTLLACAHTMSASAVLIDNAYNKLTRPDDDEARLAAGKVVGLQKKWLPAMRDAYGPAVRPDLKAQGLSAMTIGRGYRTIRVWGEPLAETARRDEFTAIIMPELRRLRFNKLEYRNSKKGKQLEALAVDAPADEEIVEWKESQANRLSVPPKVEKKVEKKKKRQPRQRRCCKICRKGKACGDSCISRRYTCRKSVGCACNG